MVIWAGSGVTSELASKSVYFVRIGLHTIYLMLRIIQESEMLNYRVLVVTRYRAVEAGWTFTSVPTCSLCTPASRGISQYVVVEQIKPILPCWSK